MRRLACAILIIAIMVGGLVFVGTLHFDTVQASADVIGIISSDTTWTKANSPYTFTGNVLVSNGVTLTIEPGVTVNLNSYYIMVNGTLSARGSSTDPIYINGLLLGKITFTQYSSGWNEQTDSGNIIENAIISYTEIDFSGASSKINNNYIAAKINIDGGSPIISNNNIPSGSGVIGSGMGYASEFNINGGSPVISNNNFNLTQMIINGGSPVISNNNFIGFTSYNSDFGGWHRGAGGIEAAGGNPYITGNTISNCSTGILASGGTIERNYLFNNDFGIEIGNSIIRSNTIVNNGIGISVRASSLPTIIYNNIEGNGASIRLSQGKPAYDVNATFNWWGTTDTQAINQSIYDFKNDFNLGTVTFVPFLTAPNPEAPTTALTPITPTPPPTQSPQPNQSPSPSPSQEPTASPDQSNTQAAPQIELYQIAIAVLGTIIAALLIVIVAMRRKSGIQKKSAS